MPDALDDDDAPPEFDYVGHLVFLDEDQDASFFTTSREKADEAVRILGAALGLDRVSGRSWQEGDLERWRRTVDLWAKDPRIAQRRPDQ